MKRKGHIGSVHDYSRETVQKVIDLCNQGIALKKIAKDLDVVYESVVRMVNGQYYKDMDCENYTPYQGTKQSRYFTDKQARKIRDLHHKSGLRVIDICNQFPSAPRAIITQILMGKTYKEAGGEIGINPTQLDPDDVKLIREMYLKTNLAIRDIAKQLGYTHSQIQYALKNDNYDCEIPPIENLEYRRRSDYKMKIDHAERDRIRERYASGEIKMPALAREYDVDISYISLIIAGKR